MLGYDAGDMSVVVLDAYLVLNIKAEGEFRGQVIGVQVVCYSLRFDIEETSVVFYPGAKRGEGLNVFQVAYVVANKRLLPFAEREGVLQMPAAREQGGVALEW